MTGFRMAAGGRIDRSKPLRFTFDGRQMHGHAGDTLASALLANGIHLVGRSFKYHRPRGIVSAGAEEPNALVTIDRGGGRETPNLRATQVELYEGLVARSQNRFPGLRFDIGGINNAFSRFLGAGFYYKTFMGPRFAGGAKLWARLFEPAIRRAAGLGKAPAGPDPDRYSNRFAHCEVLVIGGGEAGLAEALRRSEDPACRVILCDEQAEFGGWMLVEAPERADEMVEALSARPNVTMLRRSQAFGAYAQNFVAIAEQLSDAQALPDPDRPRERLWQVRAGEVVLASGAIERPLVFPDNDRPGILLAGAAETYLRRYGVLPGRKIVVLAACDTAYGAAFALQDAGAEIVAIAETRAAPGAGEIAARALARGIPVLPGTTILGTTGHLRVSGVQLGRIRPDGTAEPSGGFTADTILMSGGWTPSIHLFSQTKGKLRWEEGLGAYVPAAPAPGQTIRVIGAASGEMPAGMRSPSIGALPVAGSPDRVKAFVDFQNDVTARDLRLATREGFRSIEHVKRYTTTGMATDQGKTSNLNTLGIVAAETGRAVPEIGLTTFRAPYTPVTFGLFAGQARGDLFEPVRRTPMHDWAERNGAVFEDVGSWKRAHYFLPRRPVDPAAAGHGAMHDAVKAECRRVREAVGLFDASTLGKIELVGPDAAEFLERAYVNPVRSLGIGRCRYALLLNEAGFIIDDGIIARLAEDRFHLTTTTGGAARVFGMFEDYLQTEWPDLKVWQTSVTEHWAVIAVQGPRAREIIADLVEGIDLSNAAFPHMAVREGRIAGLPCRLFRVSFTGELGYEINIPAGLALPLWEQLAERAAEFGGGPYGTEAMHVLRAEKGYIIVGQDTDGTMTPEDMGLGWAIGKKKPDFIGKRGLMRPDLTASGRKQLVGLVAEDPARVLEEGAQIVADSLAPAGTHALGHVTSAYFSASLGQGIALAVVEDGRNRIGQTLHIPMERETIAVRVVAPLFLDPEGGRLHG
ncbi:MAG: 2Fe-2S iron-sulfur cluster-binding protein [Beijerinckiaceae bacterium]|nr:2Fe-2S iron-sulfur cluster-binding protein [Beijerinckiaceae bacterium]